MEERKHTNPDGEVVTIYIGEWAKIGAGAVIGGWAKIGGRANIGVGAVIGERAVIGVGANIGEWAKIGAGAKRHAVRSDGYVFTVGTLNGVPTVWAGRRGFSEGQARTHWGDPAHPHRAETLAILDFLFR